VSETSSVLLLREARHLYLSMAFHFVCWTFSRLTNLTTHVLPLFVSSPSPPHVQLRLQGGDMPAALGHFADARHHSRSFPELHDALACELVATAHQGALARLASSS